nr:hypothetical protein [Tanacetum cinerariifolium]
MAAGVWLWWLLTGTKEKGWCGDDGEVAVVVTWEVVKMVAAAAAMVGGCHSGACHGGVAWCRWVVDWINRVTRSNFGVRPAARL